MGGTGPLWPLGKATSGPASGVRQGVVCIVAAALPCLHKSAQMWPPAVKFNRFPGLARRPLLPPLVIKVAPPREKFLPMQNG